MPIRSFLCPVCNEPFELILNRESFTNSASATCPECGTDSPAAGLETPARRNPQHGIQK